MLSIMWVGPMQSVEGLIRTKQQTLAPHPPHAYPRLSEIPATWVPLNWNIIFTPCLLDPIWNMSSSWDSSLPAFGLELNFWLIWISLFYQCLSIYLPIYLLSGLFLWITLLNINKYYIDKRQFGKSDLCSAYVTKNLGASQVHCKHSQWQI